MIDEPETRVDPRDHGGDRHYGETLLYDFAKFLTTLSLLALGGVLSVVQGAQQGDLKFGNIAMVLGAMSIGGAIAFTTANSVVEARARGRDPHKSLPGLLKAASAFLGIGTGGFLMMWWDTLA